MASLKHSIQRVFANMSARRGSSYEIDMCNGPLLSKMVKFAIPLALSSVLQLMFHAADIIVVGQYSGPTALAAVGSTGAVTNLFVTLFMGLSVGTNVLTARYYGSERYDDLTKTVHTSVAVSILFGVILVVVGQLVTVPMLTLMGSPADVIDQASLYMKIIFAGMPASLLYNFGAAILRAVGDTRRPMYFLTLSGVLNVLINLFLVIVVGMGVEGVAIATIFAQYVSAGLVLQCLVRSPGVYRVVLKEVRIYKQQFIEMLKIGLPAGVQGATFSISNSIIQSSINSFGSVVMAGNTSAASLEGFTFVAVNAFHQAAVSFVSQNLGAKKYSRVKKVAWMSMGIVASIGVVLGVIMFIFATPLLSIYNNDPEVISYGILRMQYTILPYFLMGMMDVMIGILRGLGFSFSGMVNSIFGVCVFRIAWIYTAFASTNSLDILYLSYPISWALTSGVAILMFVFAQRKMPKEDGV